MNARTLLGMVAALGVAASSASAVVINPGQWSALSGTNSAQSPWLSAPSPSAVPTSIAVLSSPTTAVYVCTLLVSQGAAVPLATPVLSYRFENTLAQDDTRRIASVSFTGYKDIRIDADFRLDTGGVGDPKRVRRSADGDTLTFEFETPIPGNVAATRFFFAYTNGATIVNDGTATLVLTTGESRTVTGIPRPSLGVAPQAPSCAGDTNGDGVINFADLNAVLSDFGQPCP